MVLFKPFSAANSGFRDYFLPTSFSGVEEDGSSLLAHAGMSQFGYQSSGGSYNARLLFTG